MSLKPSVVANMKLFGWFLSPVSLFVCVCEFQIEAFQCFLFCLVIIPHRAKDHFILTLLIILFGANVSSIQNHSNVVGPVLPKVTYIGTCFLSSPTARQLWLLGL